MPVHSVPSPERDPFRPALEASGQEALASLESLRIYLGADPRLAPIAQRLGEAENLLRQRCRQGQFMRQIAHVLGAADRPEQLAALVLDVLLTELGASQGILWTLGEQGFMARGGMGFDRRRLAALRLPAPQPFPGYPLLSYPCQWLEPEQLPPALRLIQARAGDGLFFVPFEHQMLLVGFAVLSLSHDPPRSEAEEETLEILQRLFAASLYGVWLVGDLESRRAQVQQRAEDLQRETERLERQNQALCRGEGVRGDFLAYAARELRAQLTRILALLNQVRQDRTLSAEERGARLLDGLLVGKHMAELLRDLGELARPGKGGPVDEARPVDAGRLLAELRPVVESFPRRAGGTLQWPEEADLPDVLADEGALRQVLLSLCAGALGASADGSLALWVEREPMSLVLRLRVEGLRLGPAHASFNARRPLLPEELYLEAPGGAGLGLVISRQILDAMGGALRIDPDPEGPGSIVSLLLPLA